MKLFAVLPFFALLIPAVAASPEAGGSRRGSGDGAGRLAKAYATAWKDGGDGAVSQGGRGGGPSYWRFDLPAAANEWDAQLPA
ncbi:MAG: hypothetical protein U1F87_11260 [Kiritimatiellia bacterium]